MEDSFYMSSYFQFKTSVNFVLWLFMGIFVLEFHSQILSIYCNFHSGLIPNYRVGISTTEIQRQKGQVLQNSVDFWCSLNLPHYTPPFPSAFLKLLSLAVKPRSVARGLDPDAAADWSQRKLSKVNFPELNGTTAESEHVFLRQTALNKTCAA